MTDISTITDFLGANWWQGIAGVAQITAAVLSLVAIKQASAVLKKAEAARHDSVNPDWDVVSATNLGGGPTMANLEWIEVHIDLLNTGFGPARDATVTFQPENGNQARNIFAQGQRGNGTVVPPGDILLVRLQWNLASLLDGRMIVHCKTRFGEFTKSFHVRTYNRDEKHRCEIV